MGNINVWFSSDYHFSHTNIIRYCGRPFVSSVEMNDTIISNHNDLVKPGDIVYFLGDVSFRDPLEYIKRMNGFFIFIRGNHDPKEIRKRAWKSTIIEYEKKKILCVHNPCNIYGNYSLNVVGHVHEKWLYRPDINAINVGVDVNDFKPVSLETVMGYCKK